MSFRSFLVFLAALSVLAAEDRLPDTTLTPADQEGLALAEATLNLARASSFTNAGTIVIKPRGQDPTEFPVHFRVVTTGNRWMSQYEAIRTNPGEAPLFLTIVDEPGAPSRYFLGDIDSVAQNPPVPPEQVATMKFAGSDFWLCDLGLEFLRWPVQRLVKKDMVRGQACNVLESVNPTAPAAGYQRVVSWIDIDTGGIVLATAYDVEDRVMKEFVPKRMKKIDGEWRPIEMRMEDRPGRSRTSIIFDVDTE